MQMKLEACQKPTRAVHIKLIEAMSTDSFINTLRRFFSIRGPAKLLRSDRGANFVGTCRELDMATNDLQSQSISRKKDAPGPLTVLMLLTWADPGRG